MRIGSRLTEGDEQYRDVFPNIKHCDGTRVLKTVKTEGKLEDGMSNSLHTTFA